jgi:disulfide oxidoreductase YuzD
VDGLPCAVGAAAASTHTAKPAAVDPDEEWLRAQVRRLEDSSDGAFETAVVTLATAYDRNKDQALDEVEFNELVHDLLCVRDGVVAV